MRADMPWILALLLVLPGRSDAASSLRRGHENHQGHRGGGGAAGRASGGASAENSLAEVIELLGKMLKEFNDQESEDKDNWQEYSEWSDEAEVDKNEFVQKQKALQMSLTAKMNANKQLVQKLASDLKDLEKDIADTKSSIKDLITMRKEEHETFEASLKDLTKTISAVGKATEILEGHYAASGAALSEIRQRVQLALTMYSVRRAPQDIEELTGLLQGGGSLRRSPDYLSVDGSKYNTYEKQGGAKGVLGMLDDLRSQLETQKQELISNEADSQRQFDETKAAKLKDLKGLQGQHEDKTEKKQTAHATIATCETGIAEAKVAITEGEEYVTLLLADRAKFSKQKDNRMAERSNEMAATQAALDALQAVSAGAKAGVGEGASAAAFLQTASVRGHSVAVAKVGKLRHVLEGLLPLGKQLKSVALVQTVTKILQDYMGTEQGSFYNAGSFGPVVKLLDDLITRLEAEQSAETSQHEWCETEKETSVKARAERETTIKDLTASIESLTTSIAQLRSEIVFMESEIKRVEGETKVAKKIRKSEHDLFVKAKADHEEVIAAIKQAISALSGQYGFLQLASRHQGQRQQPGGDTPFSEYASGDASAASAQEMLNDLESRYETALADLTKDENDSQAAHNALLKTNKLFVDSTTSEKNAKMKERREQLTDLKDDKAEMKTSVVELHEISKYLQDLRPSCDDIRSTFEERKKRREAEIAALKEALEVLSDPTSSL